MDPTLNVLLVEEKHPTRQSLEESLRADGYGVVSASNGVDGLRVLAEHQPDIVVTSLLMSVMDGLEFCKRVRETSQVPVLVFGHAADREARADILEAGANDYSQTDTDDLSDVVERLGTLARQAEPGPSKSQGQASLSVQGGPNSGMMITLSDGPVVLGRGVDNDGDIDHETVSRRHAVIMEASNGFVVRDLNSANGTFLNRVKLAEGEHPLSNGDKIRIGGSEVAFFFRQKGPSTVKMRRGAGSDPAEVREDAEAEASPERPLSQKDSELLKYLESKRGVAVRREEIAGSVWPERPLDELLTSQEIDRAILRVRTHIKDDPRMPKHLITAGEYGYLLV